MIMSLFMEPGQTIHADLSLPTIGFLPAFRTFGGCTCGYPGSVFPQDFFLSIIGQV